MAAIDERSGPGDCYAGLLRIASKPLLGPMSAPDIPQGFEYLEEPPLGSTILLRADALRRTGPTARSWVPSAALAGEALLRSLAPY
jgi:hypothetical protein